MNHEQPNNVNKSTVTLNYSIEYKFILIQTYVLSILKIFRIFEDGIASTNMKYIFTGQQRSIITQNGPPL